MARAGGRRTFARGDPEPPRCVGAHRHHAVRPWAAVFAFTNHDAVARDLVHADRMGRGAVRAADRAQLVLALSRRMGAHRRNAIGAVRRRTYRGSNETAVSRDPGAAGAAPVGAGARTGAGAVARRRGEKQLGSAAIVRTIATLRTVMVARAAMTAPATMQRKTIRLAAAILEAVLSRRGLWLRCSSGDEGRQTLGHIACFRLRRTRLRPRLLRLLSVVLFARLIRLLVALDERLCIRRDVGLRLLARAVALIGGEGLLRVVAAVLEILLVARLELLVVAAAAFGPGLEVRVLLAELFVRRRDQAEIMLGMLEVVFGRDRIAGGLGIARKLEIFLRRMMGRAADLHVGPVRLVNPGQRVVAAPVVIVVVAAVIVVAPAHALVVMLMLTV